MIKVAEIRVNYECNPEGVTGVPLFSWELNSDQRNVMQSIYQLQISEDPSFESLCYDSGKKESDQSAGVRAAKLELKSATKYYLRVKVEADDQVSEWSDTHYFITALLKVEDWKASFITAETKDEADISKGTYVRNTFQVKGKVKQAFAYTTALGLYEFYINGKKVGNDELTPGWTSYHKHLTYQTYEVTEALSEGTNGLGASLAAGWYKGTMGFDGLRNFYGDRTGFLCQLVIQYEDGTSDLVVSDESWIGHDSPVLFAEIYDGEIYDARKEIKGWSENGKMDDSWKPVQTITVDKKILDAQIKNRVQEMDQVPAKKIFKTPQGDTVIDFGQNMTGRIHVKAKGRPGDVIEVHCFEVLDKDGNVYLDNLRGAKQSLTYTFGDEGVVEYHPSFTFMGFQFAKIVSYPGEPTVDDFTAYTTYTFMESTGTFETSNKDINQLQHNILWGMKGNFVDVPTDCPQRDERLGWTGDAQIFCRTAAYLMNTYQFYKKWLKDVAADQTPEGGVPHVVPDIVSGYEENNWLLKRGTHSAAAWADVAVINPWTMYLSYGDTQILEDQFESMKGWIDFMADHAVDYIWNYKLQFGDWVALDAEEGSYFGATPNDLTCTAYFAYSTNLFIKILKALNKDGVDKYQSLYDNIVNKFRTTFFDNQGKMTAQTQTAHILALYFNLVPDAYRDKTAKNLVALLEKEGGHLVTGFVGTPYFCHALSQNGYLDQAYDLLLKDDFPSWLYQVKQGATTIWEHWDGKKPDGSMWSPDMNSFNHYAYGAIGEWMYRVVGGIEVDEMKPGFKHSLISPRLGGGLEFVKASYKSVYGEVRSAWKDQGEVVEVTVEIPVNTTATISLQGSAIVDSDGLEFDEKDLALTANAGSGTYVITYKK